MKLRNLFALAFCILAVACASENKSDSAWSEKSEDPFEDRQIEKSLKNYTYKADFPICPGNDVCYKFDYDIELPVKDFPAGVIQTMQQNILSLAFQQTIRDTDWDSLVATNVDWLVRDWKRSHQEEIAEYGVSAMMEERSYIKGRMLDPYSGIVSYVCQSYGPGFNSYKTSINMDIRTGQIVNESNLFRSGYRPILRELLLEHLPQDLDRRCVDLHSFQPSEYFYITKEGITYMYPQGEIGSMADGVIEVAIPWNAFSILRVR